MSFAATTIVCVTTGKAAPYRPVAVVVRRAILSSPGRMSSGFVGFHAAPVVRRDGVDVALGLATAGDYGFTVEPLAALKCLVDAVCRRGTPHSWFNPPITSTSAAAPAAYRRPA